MCRNSRKYFCDGDNNLDKEVIATRKLLPKSNKERLKKRKKKKNICGSGNRHDPWRLLPSICASLCVCVRKKADPRPVLTHSGHKPNINVKMCLYVHVIAGRNGECDADMCKPKLADPFMPTVGGAHIATWLEMQAHLKQVMGLWWIRVIQRNCVPLLPRLSTHGVTRFTPTAKRHIELKMDMVLTGRETKRGSTPVKDNTSRGIQLLGSPAFHARKLLGKVRNKNEINKT